MVVKIDLKVVLVIIAILLCGVSGSERSVTAQSAGEIENSLSLPQAGSLEVREPVPGGPGYVFVSPFAMIPRLSSQYYVFSDSALQTAGTSASYFNFPVNVPHGVTITKLVAYFADFDASYNMIVNLFRENYSDFNRTSMGQAVSFGSAGYINASDTSKTTTDNWKNNLRMVLSGGFPVLGYSYSFTSSDNPAEVFVNIPIIGNKQVFYQDGCPSVGTADMASNNVDVVGVWSACGQTLFSTNAYKSSLPLIVK